jgi:hypothetical protein
MSDNPYLASLAQKPGLLSADPVGDFDGGAPRGPFEFFPPKTPGLEERVASAGQAFGACAFLFLRSGRLDP